LFKNVRLLDILKQHEDIFELQSDGLSGGWTVKPVAGALAALPGAAAVSEQTLMLPDRIENPIGTKEKMQALRIELLHALSRRGNRVALQELGQEARVQQRKQGLHQARKLVDFIRIFPENFRVSSDETQMIVETASTNVADQTMIELSIQRSQQAMQKFHEKGGKGFGNRSRHHDAPSRQPQYVPMPAPAQPPVWTPPQGFSQGFSQAFTQGFSAPPPAPPQAPAPPAPPWMPAQGFSPQAFSPQSFAPQGFSAHPWGSPIQAPPPPAPPWRL